MFCLFSRLSIIFVEKVPRSVSTGIGVEEGEAELSFLFSGVFLFTNVLLSSLLLEGGGVFVVVLNLLISVFDVF